MAINEGLEIVISADVARAEKGIQSVSNSLKRLPAGATAAQNGLNKLSQSSNAANQSLINLGRVVQDAPFGFLGIANNLNPLLESFQRLKAQTGSNKLAFQSLASSLTGPAGIGIAISVVSSLLIVFGDKIFGAGKKAEEAEEKVKTLNDTLKEIRSSAAKEASDVAGLIGILKSETETRERKLQALKNLQGIQPEIFNGLRLEGNLVNGLDTAYKAYLESLRLVITAKLKQAQLEKVTENILEKEGLILTKSQKEALGRLKEIIKKTEAARKKSIALGEGGALGQKLFQKETQKQAEELKALNDLYSDQEQLIKDITSLSRGIKLKIEGPGKIDVDKIEEPIVLPVKIQVSIGEIDNSFKEDLAKTKGNLLKTAKIFGDNSKIIKGIVPGVDKDVQARNDKFFNDYQTKIQATAEIVSGTLTAAFDGFFQSISEGGNAITGFLKGLGNALTQVIKKLIATVAIALVLSAITGGVGGAGIAGAKGFSAIFKKLSGFAEGGIVSAPTLGLIGEGAGTRNSNPEIVAPLNKLKDILGDSGGSQRVSGTLKASGSELIAVIESTERRQGRSF